MTEYVTIKIPESLAKEIDALLKAKGYSSRADFAKDAIRRFLESYK
jgi:metal-responsive CopG/Arc/MetJ family transcriptional regulator